jgi:Ca2+/H+ antiporter
MAGAVGLTALMVRDGRSHRWEGMTLVASFVAVAVWFWFAGPR